MAKSKSKTWELFGTFRWSKCFPQNREMDGPEGTDYREHDGMYTTDFIMDEENLEKFEETGSNWKVYGQTKKDREKHNLLEGQYLIRPRRMHRHKIDAFGGPPVVVKADGSPIDPEEGFGVGNGSEGYIQFTTYETTLQTGSRWDGMQVTKWVKFPLARGAGARFENRGETEELEAELPDRDEEEAPKSSREPSSTREKATKAKAKPLAADEDLDDEIPL